MNEHLQHAEATAADAVLAFYKQHLNNTFTADELRSYVAEHITGTVSPSTADRVLRNLRIQSKLDYVVLNRGKSIYKAIPVNGATDTPMSTEQQVQQRAYELYEKRGKVDGYELEDWAQAESEIVAPAKEGWVVQRNDRGNWRESWNIGLHDETFDTEEAADIAIVAYGSQGEEYRSVRK